MFSKGGRSEIRILCHHLPTAGLCPKTLHLDIVISPPPWGDSIQVLPAVSFWKCERYRLSYRGWAYDLLGILEASFEIYSTIAQGSIYLFIAKNRNKVGKLIDRLVVASIFYYASSIGPKPETRRPDRVFSQPEKAQTDIPGPRPEICLHKLVKKKYLSRYQS